MNTAAKNTFFGADNHYYQAGVHNPSLIATPGKVGALYIQVPEYPDTTLHLIWQKFLTNGNDTNWQPFPGNDIDFNMLVEDDGLSVKQNPTFMNFIGAGVTAVADGLGVDILIPGGGGGGSLIVEDEGTPINGGNTCFNLGA